jgi:spermidine synthase
MDAREDVGTAAAAGGAGPARVLSVLFVVTGAVGLLAEQAFERMLSTLLGTSTPAGAVVLAVYFAGLTTGSALYSRLLRPRFANPLRVYATIEAGVGTWSLLLVLSLDLLPRLFTPLLALGVGSPVLLALLRGVVAVAWVFPPTFLMGASFPAVVDSIEALRVPRPGSAMARFYALNVAGAVAAAASAPYTVFPALGLDGTLLAAAFLDLSVAVVAFRLARRAGEARSPAGGEPPQEEPVAASRASGAVLVGVAAASGFLFFALEVLWFHLLQVVIGNSVFAFAAMLSAVLAGLGIGGFLVSRIRPSALLPVTVPAGLCLLSALSLSLFHSRWPHVPASFVGWGKVVTTFAGGELARWAEALLQVGPTAIVLGALYPSLFRLEIFPGRDRAAAAGRLGAVNAAGCVLGSLAAAFLLLPRLGSEASLLTVAAAYALCGAALLLVSPRGRARVVVGVSAAAVLAVTATRPPWDLLALTSGQHVFFHEGHVDAQTRLLFFHEDAYGGATTVVGRPTANGGVRQTLLTNGKFQGNDTGEVPAQTAVALLPILHARSFDSALVSGLGTGRSAAVPALFGYRSVDVAEIAPGVVEAARTRFAAVNGRVLDRPGVHLVLEDGRNSLLLRPSTYDLVTMEVSSVWFAGSTNLYSREFYEVVRRRLRPGGVFQQWLQVHHIGIREHLSVLATVRDVFPYASFWFLGGQGIVVASAEPLEVQPASLSRFEPACGPLGFPPSRAGDVLRDLLSTRLLSPHDLDAVAHRPGVPRNTDRNRWLEYATPRYNLVRRDLMSENLSLMASLSSFEPHAVAAGPPGRLVDVARSVRREDIERFLRLRAAPRLPGPGASPPSGGAARTGAPRAPRSPTPRGRRPRSGT